MLDSKKIQLVAVAAVLLTSGCARNISGDTYKASAVGEASSAFQGTIIAARSVTVEEGESLEDNKTGILLGGLGGGVAGHQFGHGKGNLAATVGGAVLGAAAGAFAEKALKSQTAMEYTVKLTNGSLRTLVQTGETYAVGQRVIVNISQDGRSRIVPDNSGYQDVQPMHDAPARRKQVEISHRR